MSGTHNDLKRLIKHSIKHNCESAILEYPMFSPEQVRSLFDITISQRMDLLEEWGSAAPDLPHVLHKFHDPHDPAQAEKIRQLAADPSN